MDGTISIEEIKRLINKLNYTVKINYQQCLKKKVMEFHSNPSAYLIQECNRKSKELRSEVEIGLKEPNIPYYRLYAIMKNEIYCDDKIAEMIQVIDTMKNKYEYARNIVGSAVHNIDFNMRNSFYNGVKLLTIKYVAKFNHYNARNQIINKGLPSSECPQCLEREDWRHIIKYKAISQERKELIKRLHNKMIKAKTSLDIE